MDKIRVLLVEDEPTLAMIIKDTLDGEEFGNRESEILKRLCENKDHVLPMKDVLLELWGDDSFFNARSLHVFITKLRHKLSKDESIKILNVRGIGYKLIID